MQGAKEYFKRSWRYLSENWIPDPAKMGSNDSDGSSGGGEGAGAVARAGVVKTGDLYGRLAKEELAPFADTLGDQVGAATDTHRNHPLHPRHFLLLLFWDGLTLLAAGARQCHCFICPVRFHLQQISTDVLHRWTPW